MKRRKEKSTSNIGEKIALYISFILPLIIFMAIGGIIGNNNYHPVEEEKVETFKSIANIVYWHTQDTLEEYQEFSILLSAQNVQEFMTTHSIKFEDYEDFEVLLEKDVITVSDKKLMVKVYFYGDRYQVEVMEDHTRIGNIILGAGLGAFIFMGVFLLIIIFIIDAIKIKQKKKQFQQQKEE